MYLAHDNNFCYLLKIKNGILLKCEVSFHGKILADFVYNDKTQEGEYTTHIYNSFCSKKIKFKKSSTGCEIDYHDLPYKYKQTTLLYNFAIQELGNNFIHQYLLEFLGIKMRVNVAETS